MKICAYHLFNQICAQIYSKYTLHYYSFSFTWQRRSEIPTFVIKIQTYMQSMTKLKRYIKLCLFSLSKRKKRRVARDYLGNLSLLILYFFCLFLKECLYKSSQRMKWIRTYSAYSSCMQTFKLRTMYLVSLGMCVIEGRIQRFCFTYLKRKHVKGLRWYRIVHINRFCSKHK